MQCSRTVLEVKITDQFITSNRSCPAKNVNIHTTHFRTQVIFLMHCRYAAGYKDSTNPKESKPVLPREVMWTESFCFSPC